MAYPALSHELGMINIETRAGKPRLEALKNFSRRTQVDDARALVTMLVQTDRFGTSVAQALRTHAEVSRTKRRQRAEEKAAKLGVKLIFPLVFCLLPAFFVVAVGPAIIKFVEFFSNNDFGGIANDYGNSQCGDGRTVVVVSSSGGSRDSSQKRPTTSRTPQGRCEPALVFYSDLSGFSRTVLRSISFRTAICIAAICATTGCASRSGSAPSSRRARRDRPSAQRRQIRSRTS